MNTEQPNNLTPETPASSAEILTCNDWVGSRVRVVEGAWKGSEGTVRDVIMGNGALRVKLDESLTLGWFPSELEKLPTLRR